MSTRRLIITALVCGMAILLAGGVFLVRIAHNQADLTANVYQVGDQVRVGDLSVRVVKVTRRADAIAVGVEVDASAATIAAPADAVGPWSMVIRAPRPAVAPIATDGPACQGQQIVAGRLLACTVAFSAAQGAPYLAFSWPGRPQAQWRLG